MKLLELSFQKLQKFQKLHSPNNKSFINKNKCCINKNKSCINKSKRKKPAG